MTKKILSVGNCSYDQGALERLISAHFDAELTAAPVADDALNELRSGRFDLVLVSRKFFDDAGDGIELIKRIASDPECAGTRLMLLSNLADAQQQAIQAGAEPGFGKAEYDRPETVEKLRRQLDDQNGA